MIATAAATATLALIAFTPLRSPVATAALKIALRQRGGFALHTAAFHIDAGRIEMSGVEIDDSRGSPVFKADHVIAAMDSGFWIGRSPWRYGLRSLDVRRPVIYVERMADGSYNLSPLLSGGGGAGSAARLRLTVNVADARLEFRDPFAAAPGRRFSLENANVRGEIDSAGITRLNAELAYAGDGKRAPVSIELLEDEASRFAIATLRAKTLEVAPIVDGLVPSRAFVIEEGTLADVELRAYALDYAAASGPDWALSGSGYLTGARFRVLPLTVPVRDVSGQLRFAGGNLSTTGLRGSLEGSPVAIDGGIRLLGGALLGLSVASMQPLSRLRHALAFSTRLDVSGPVDVGLRINGPPDDLNVAGQYRALQDLNYQGLPLGGVHGTLFYYGGHISLPNAFVNYDGGSARVYGDIDMTSDVVSGAFNVAATMPAEKIPIAANVNPNGLAQALIEMDGPLGALRGTAFARIGGGNGISARTAIFAGPDRFAVGPAIITQPDGGELMLRGAIDRGQSPRTIAGDLIARHASLRVIAAVRALPGINDASPIALPAVDGTVDGSAFVRGDERGPAVAVNATADRLIVSGTQLGHVVIVASGRGGRMRIVRATIDGNDATIAASGEMALAPHSGEYAAALRGQGHANLAALFAHAPWARAAGIASGTFSAALAGGRWTALVRASSADAKLGGVVIRSVDASVGGGGGGTTDIYAGHLQTAGGDVSAVGVVPAAEQTGADLHVWSDDLDLKSLASLGAPLDRGRAIAIAHIGGSLAKPVLSGSASISGSGIGDQPLSGDFDVDYSNGRLVARDGRIAVGGGFAVVNGTVTGLGPGMTTSTSKLSMTASMREGDLGALAGRYMPKTLHLGGTVAATLRVSGTLGAPHLSGYVAADSGTLQGVAFEDLRGAVNASSHSIQVSGGSVSVASSKVAFSGSLSPAELHVKMSSGRIDLADFNDFFAGYDTLEGAGRGDVAFESTRTGVLAYGHVSVAKASVGGFPLGVVDADFSSRRDQVLARMRQSGDAGSSDLAGTITFAPRTTALPDLAHSRYDVRGSVRGLDVSRVTPLMGRENLGLSGFLDVDGVARGTLRAPAGHADFNLREGHVGKVAISEARGSIDTDGERFALKNAAVTLPFARVDGEGAYGPNKRLVASFGIDASDLGTLLALLGHPGVASGTALATVNVSGTTSAPHISTTIVSGRGSAFGIGVDRFTGKLTYAPGEVDISDTQAVLAQNRGAVTIGGTLPLQLRPFGLGPKEKRIDIVLAAKGVDVSALDPLAKGYASMSGALDAQISVSGTAGRPQLAGIAHLRNGGASSPFETVPAERVEADLMLARDTLTLSRLTGTLGRGTFAGSGSVHIVPAVGLQNVAGLQYWTRLDLRGAQIDVPGWSSGILNGNLRLTKSGPTPYITGDVTLDDGNIPFSAIYALASGFGTGPAPSGPIPGVPDVQPGHIVVYGGGVFGLGGPYVRSNAQGTQPTATAVQLPSADLNVTARAGRNVRVHGGAIDLTAGGSILIAGNLQSPTLAGMFTSTRGQIGYFDTNFRLVRGTVTFDPIEGLLPTLDVKAITNLNGAEITLTVTGRVDNLQTDLSSNPSMSRDEIIATLLHAPQVASVVSAAPGTAQSQLYAEAQSYFNAQLSRSLLFPVESLIAQTINVEQISLIYDQQGKVDIEVRKLVTPTVYAIYRSSLNIPVSQTAGVAYSLRDYADLEILQTQSPTGLSQSVLNLRLTFH